jgi:hypothetical protein
MSIGCIDAISWLHDAVECILPSGVLRLGVVCQLNQELRGVSGRIDHGCHPLERHLAGRNRLLAVGSPLSR